MLRAFGQSKIVSGTFGANYLRPKIFLGAFDASTNSAPLAGGGGGAVPTHPPLSQPPPPNPAQQLPGPPALSVDNVLCDGVFRFDADPTARALAWPSLFFANPVLRDRPRQHGDPQGAAWRLFGAHGLWPRFERTELSHVVTFGPLPDGTSIYGLGGQAGALLRNEVVRNCWNSDPAGTCR